MPTMYETNKILKALSMDYEKIDCCPKVAFYFKKSLRMTITVKSVGPLGIMR
jgi:hypothetical protein